MLFKKEEKTPDVFWQEYEEKTGEKVLARGLGKYVYGWQEFDEKKLKGIWGLIIITSGGFRFHHFPQKSWADSLAARFAKNQSEEKTIFISKEKIVSTEMTKETKWWKRFFVYSPPHLVIRYTDTGRKEQQLVFEAEYNSNVLPCASCVLFAKPEETGIREPAR